MPIRRNFLPRGVWVKSSRSEQTACVEVDLSADAVLVRSSTDHAGPVLAFSQDEWEAFVLGVKGGEFDVR